MSFSSANNQLKCTDATLQGHVQMDLAQITYTLQFEPPSHIEGEFAFVLPRNSTICQLVILSGSTRIVAEVKEKEEALMDYSDNMSQGQSAFIGVVDEENKDMLTFNMSTLEVGQPIQVELAIVTTSNFNAAENNWALFVSPLSNTPIKSCAITLLMPSAVTVQKNRTFSIAQPEPCVAHLTSSAVTSSFCVEYTCANTYEPAVLVQRDPVRNLTAVFLSHQLQRKEVNLHEWTPTGEYVIILDRSGSMQSNSKMELAKQATQLFIQSLPPGSYFNVISFGSRFEALFPASVEYSNETISTATAAVKAMQANFGGTDLYGPLNHVFGTKRQTNYPLYVFVVTDGQVNNTKQVVDLVKRCSQTARVSSLGIGRDASEALVTGIAAAGQGTSTITYQVEHIKKGVISILKGSLAPGLLDLHVANSEEFSLVTPLRPTYAFAGDRVHVGALLNQEAAGVLVVEYKDEYEGRVVREEFPFDGTQPTTSSAAVVLTVGRALKDMEDTHAVEHSVNFQVPCDKTALFGVKRYTPAAAPVMLGVAGKHGSGSGFRGRCMKMASRSRPSTQAVTGLEYLSTLSYHAPQKRKKKECARDARPVSKLQTLKESCMDSLPVATSLNKELIRLLEFQDATGFWKESPELFNLLACILGYELALPDVSALALTEYILQVLNQHFADQKEEWELIEAKALRWINSNKVQSS